MDKSVVYNKGIVMPTKMENGGLPGHDSWLRDIALALKQKIGVPGNFFWVLKWVFPFTIYASAAADGKTTSG
jgi:hypothetical protein